MNVLCVYLAVSPGATMEQNAIIEATEYPLSKSEIEELYEGLVKHAQSTLGQREYKIVLLNLLPLREGS